MHYSHGCRYQCLQVVGCREFWGFLCSEYQCYDLGGRDAVHDGVRRLFRTPPLYVHNRSDTCLLRHQSGLQAEYYKKQAR